MGGDPREAGVYPMGLRLGEHQERTLRKWPLGRIKPKSVALGLRSFMAEVDALRRQLSDDSAVADAAIAHHKARADKAEAENARLRERVAALEAILDDAEPPQWLESVPSGVRWFCSECQGVISGFSEIEQDEADAAMQHQRDCRWVFAKRLRAALAGQEQGGAV